MFTREELCAIPLFSELADKELEYLAGCTGDTRVQPGEYVIHEGDARRALIVTFEGRLEATKFVEGVERVVGVRTHGDLFGEVPVVLNTPFLASLRAVEPSRVMELEAKDFHTIAAASPKIAETLGAAALDRVSGLQDIAAERSEPQITVIGPQWDNPSHELRQFLYRNSVQFDSYAPEDKEVEAYRLGSIGQQARYPIVRLKNGEILVQPALRDVARALDLCIAPTRWDYDLVIIGGGPAGLAAAVYGSSEGFSTILIEREAPGGQAGTSSRIENYLGFPFGVSGGELANRALQQARRLGAEIVVTRSVKRIDAASHAVILDGDEVLRGTTIVLAPGVSWRHLDLPALERFRGRGVYYGAAKCDWRAVQGKDIFLIGGGNSAGQAAVSLSSHANTVTLIVRGPALSKTMSHYLMEQLKTKGNIRVETHSEITDAYGDEHLEAVLVTNRATGDMTRRDAVALFVMIGADAETGWLPPEIARDERGYIFTGLELVKNDLWPLDRLPFLLETSVPGIFAVGDVRAGSVKRVAAGVGEGSMAIAFIHQYLEAAPALARL